MFKPIWLSQTSQMATSGARGADEENSYNKD
jgi:hypothetical protein